MKVKELIAQLQEMDPEAIVYINRTECCDQMEPAEYVYEASESVRDYSMRLTDPDSIKSVKSVRVE